MELKLTDNQAKLTLQALITYKQKMLNDIQNIDELITILKRLNKKQFTGKMSHLIERYVKAIPFPMTAQEILSNIKDEYSFTHEDNTIITILSMNVNKSFYSKKEFGKSTVYYGRPF